jgi:hypothetical protein
MSTTVRADGKVVVTVDSDDRAMEERLARYAMELIATRTPSGNSEWQVQKFIERCGRHESQAGLIRELVEKGKMSRSEMIKAAKKEGGSGLAGCRGSISKNAGACNLPTDWWKDTSGLTPDQHFTELRPDVREALRAEIARITI